MLNEIRQGVRVSYAVLQTFKLSDTTRYLVDLTYFGFGFSALNNLVQDHFQHHDFSTISHANPSWQEQAARICDTLGNLSFLLSGLLSGHTQVIWNRTVKLLLPEQLEGLLGNQSYFSGQKIYTSLVILSFILWIPRAVKICYLVYSWLKSPSDKIKEEDNKDIKEIIKNAQLYTPFNKGQIIATINVVSQTARKLLHTSL